jgi:hypothetical protein
MNTKRFMAYGILLLIGAVGGASANILVHIFVHSSTAKYHYFTQTVHTGGSGSGYCVRDTMAVGDRVKLNDGSSASIETLTANAPYCKSKDFPSGVTVGPVKTESCEFAVPANPDAGIYLPEGWHMQKLTCAQLAKKKDVFFTARNEALDGRFVMDDVPRSRMPANIATYAKALRDKQASNVDNGVGSEIEELQIGQYPAWRFHVQGDLKATHQAMVFIVTMIDHGNDFILINTYLPAQHYAEHADELNEIAYGIKGLDDKPVVLDDETKL